jgi:drug/metabolite transporter (DMT)-like permease
MVPKKTFYPQENRFTKDSINKKNILLYFCLSKIYILRTPMLLVFVLYALFASVFTVLKGALVFASPFFLVGSRMTIAGLLMLGYAYWKNSKTLALSKESLVKVILLGVFNIYLTNVFEVYGLRYLTSFKTCFLYSLSPFLTALMSYFLLHEKMSKRKWLGFFIGFVGFFPMLESYGKEEFFAGTFGIFSVAELSVFAAVFCSVVGWILLKQLVHKSDCPPSVANGYSMLLGGVLALLQSLALESWDPIPVTNFPVWIESTLFLIIISNIVCYNLYGILLKKFSPTFLAFAGLSTPLFTAFFGWLFHGEVITVWFFISLSIVFCGLLIFYQEELKGLEKKPPVPLEEGELPPEVLLPRGAESS